MEKGASVSVKGRRSKEMIHSSASSPRRSKIPFESQEGAMAVEVSKNKRFLVEEKESVLLSVKEGE